MRYTNKKAIVVLGVLFLAIEAKFLFLNFNTPRYNGDTGVYQYKVVVSSVWFDPKKKVSAEEPAAIHLEHIVYYTNEYDIRYTNDFKLPSVWIKHPAQFVRHMDGNYYLERYSSAAFIYTGNFDLDITVIRQADGKVIFNSSKYIRDTTILN